VDELGGCDGGSFLSRLVFFPQTAGLGLFSAAVSKGAGRRYVGREGSSLGEHRGCSEAVEWSYVFALQSPVGRSQESIAKPAVSLLVVCPEIIPIRGRGIPFP
jgi:hypothetical protein